MKRPSGSNWPNLADPNLGICPHAAPIFEEAAEASIFEEAGEASKAGIRPLV
jgi:hypothetical protein